jgi:glyoxylase-like metal-dependent hydrolase (beta-lactamase superfamily II)
MQVVQVKPEIFACLMGNETANAGFVITERGVVVIDTLNSPARGSQLAAAIKARTKKPILFVINTHHHYDHIFGNQAFDAPIIAHCALSEQLAQAAARDLMPVSIAAWLSQHPEDRWLVDELELAYPNIIFDHRLVLDLPPTRIVVRHLGGHTPDTSIVDLPDEGVLFSGDLVFEGRVPFLRQANIKDTIQALRELARLGARTVVPGHGALCDTGYVLSLRDYLIELREKVAELAAREWKRGDILDSDQLPQWRTKDRPDLLRANVERIYDELMGITANR